MDALHSRASIAVNLVLCGIAGGLFLWHLARADDDPTADRKPPSVVLQPSKPSPAIRLPVPPPASPPSPASADPPSPPAEPKDHTVEAADDGRLRLRLFEHGQGPAIEIAWPTAAAARRRLHDLFVQCYGMRRAILDGRGDLYGTDGRAGQPLPINFDRYSGFVRQIDGHLGTSDAALAARIRSRHGLDPGAPLVRLFPRSVDARLLSGLGRLVGARYADARQIRAVYQLAGTAVWVESVRVDGRPLAGSVALSGACVSGPG